LTTKVKETIIESVFPEDLGNGGMDMEARAMRREERKESKVGRLITHVLW